MKLLKSVLISVVKSVVSVKKGRKHHNLKAGKRAQIYITTYLLYSTINLQTNVQPND
jgi:hypothetical protein